LKIIPTIANKSSSSHSRTSLT